MEFYPKLRLGAPKTKEFGGTPHENVDYRYWIILASLSKALKRLRGYIGLPVVKKIGQIFVNTKYNVF